ncbi:MAG: class I SAM-dependent methyltransferase [Stellaceae bacterium]
MTQAASFENSELETCRFCGGALHQFLDLGVSPLCESYLTQSQLREPETFYPLAASVCGECFLVQLPEHVSPQEIFCDYAYFSAYSDSWLAHARTYADAMTSRLELDGSSRVVEIGSNDGYLLQFFVQKGVSVLGVDPAANVAKAAEARGVRTQVSFFGTDVARRLAAEGELADLIVGNNVLAQVADLNDFVEGIRVLLKPTGIATLEFPHILQTLKGNQFDQFYHEHFSYFSALAIEKIFSAHSLHLFDVEQIGTHGGSLRIFLCHTGRQAETNSSVGALIAAERNFGLHRLETYDAFAAKVMGTKRKLLGFLIDARLAGKSIAGYGAPGKGNTLLNYCGIRTDFLDYTVDRNPHKHGKFLPGTHIPIHPPEWLTETKPDYVLVLPWNLKEEIAVQLAHVRDWGGKLVVPIPEPTVL